MPESFDHKNGILIRSAGVFNYEQAHIRRDVAGAVIKIGHLVGLSKHWSIDAFGGLGLRLMYSDHSSATGLSVYNTHAGGVVDSLVPLNVYDYDYPERQNLQVELGLKFNYLILSVKNKGKS